MKKFFAVVKREYVQRVRSRMFVIVTIGAPLMFALFTVVPILIAGIKTGGPTRVAVADQSGRMFARVSDSLKSAQSQREEDDDRRTAASAEHQRFGSFCRADLIFLSMSPPRGPKPGIGTS